jgi:Raf kinase inhibitor-like YbhB/YbcL family protein
MRNTYALLGVTSLIVALGAWYAFDGAPSNAVFTNSSGESMSSALTLRSAAFTHGTSIPSQFTCDAENISPPLQFTGVPEGAKSLVLLMDDPDIPQVFKEQSGIDSFDHWTLFNIAPDTAEISQAGSAGVRGANGSRQSSYTGPCPPREYEPSEHRYFFRLYALDAMLDLPPGSSKAAVLAAMEGHVIAEAELMGKYKRINE